MIVRRRVNRFTTVSGTVELKWGRGGTASPSDFDYGEGSFAIETPLVMSVVIVICEGEMVLQRLKSKSYHSCYNFVRSREDVCRV